MSLMQLLNLRWKEEERRSCSKAPTLFLFWIKNLHPSPCLLPPLVLHIPWMCWLQAVICMHCSQQLVLKTPLDLSSKEQQISHDLIHQVSAPFFSSFDKCLSWGRAVFSEPSDELHTKRKKGCFGGGGWRRMVSFQLPREVPFSAAGLLLLRCEASPSLGSRC